MQLAARRTSGEHARLDVFEDRVEAVDLLLRSEIVVLGLGGVWVKLLVGHGCRSCKVKCNEVGGSRVAAGADTQPWLRMPKYLYAAQGAGAEDVVCRGRAGTDAGVGV